MNAIQTVMQYNWDSQVRNEVKWNYQKLIKFSGSDSEIEKYCNLIVFLFLFQFLRVSQVIFLLVLKEIAIILLAQLNNIHYTALGTKRI